MSDDPASPVDPIASPFADEVAEGDAGDAAVPTRRRLMMLGAASASVVVTIRPALAQTTASVLTCEIPIPDSKLAGKWIAADGSVVDPFTAGAFRPPVRPLKGEAVRTVLTRGGTLPGTSYDQSRAYVAYIRRLQNGMSGFTCYASLQMPRK